MTGTAFAPSGDRASVRRTTRQNPPDPPPQSPGPKSVFVVLTAVTVGIVAALAFQAADPDTRFVILGGTLVCAGLLAVVGLYRYSWFLWGTLALRPALDDLVADEFGTFQPSAILGILVIGVSSLHLVSRRMSGNWRPMTPLGWAFVIFFCFFIPSFLTSVDRGVSQGAMFGLASVTVLYLAMEQAVLEDRAAFWKMVGAAAVGMVVPIVVGYVQFFWTGTLDIGGSGLIRVDGSFAHPNTFATYLAFAIVLAVGLLPTLDVRPRFWMLVATVLGGFLLISTFARGAWASFLLGMLLMASRINKRLVWVILLGAVGAAAVVPGVSDRVGNLTATTSPGGGVKTDDSLGWRFGYWEKVAPFFNRNPLSGIGIDATKTQTIEEKDPHNSFLQAFIEGGVIGGLGFVFLLVVATVAAIRVWRMVSARKLGPDMSRAAIASIAALFTIAAQLVTENILLNTIVWWYMNMGLALLAVLAFRSRRTPQAAHVPERRQLPAAGESSSTGVPA